VAPPSNLFSTMGIQSAVGRRRGKLVGDVWTRRDSEKSFALSQSSIRGRCRIGWSPSKRHNRSNLVRSARCRTTGHDLAWSPALDSGSEREVLASRRKRRALPRGELAGRFVLGVVEGAVA
jgi:hypothetical protein